MQSNSATHRENCTSNVALPWLCIVSSELCMEPARNLISTGESGERPPAGHGDQRRPRRSHGQPLAQNRPSVSTTHTPTNTLHSIQANTAHGMHLECTKRLWLALTLCGDVGFVAVRCSMPAALLTGVGVGAGVYNGMKWNQWRK